MNIEVVRADTFITVPATERLWLFPAYVYTQAVTSDGDEGRGM
jgi:hypothetical protein